MNDQKKPQEVSLKAKIDDAVAEGVYVNFANIMHNQSEFVIDFGRIVPGRKEFTIYSRVIVSPVHAKQLQEALRRNLEQFEKNFGEIRGIPGAPEDRRVGF